MNDARRIALNATTLLSPLTGIGQYTRSLTMALAQVPDIELHLFYGTGWSRNMRGSPIRNIDRVKRLFKALVPRPYAVSRWLAQQRFTRGARAHGIELYHEPGVLPYASEAPVVITVHDLSWIRFPETHPPQRVHAMNRLFPGALADAQHVITDAQFIRNELIRDFGVAPERVTSIPLGSRKIFRPRDANECQPTMARFALSYRSFLLCVGTLEPRKNLALALRTYAALPVAVRAKWPLVIVGMTGWLSSSLEPLIEPLAIAGQVRPIGFRSDEELAALYASARMLIYPSFYEGFGLPPLEAMASGTPVITSNRSTLPEVVAGAGLMVDPDDDKALAETIQRLLNDQRTWDFFAAACLTQAAKFSWERCAAETVSTYHKVLAKA